MRRNLLCVLSLLGIVLVPAMAAAEPSSSLACPGISADRFDRKVPPQVRRYAFDDRMLEPFMRLWRAARRPDLPAAPEKVTVYDQSSNRPVLIGYQTGGCMIAFLSVDRQHFFRWLRPQLGWSI